MTNLQYGTPEYRLYRTANRYKITVQQLRDKLKTQNYECTICGCELFEDTLTVDHNYNCCEATARKNTCGKCTRDLICHSCNLLIGAIEKAQKEGILDVIIRYIENYRKTSPDFQYVVECDYDKGLGAINPRIVPHYNFEGLFSSTPITDVDEFIPDK